MASPNKQEKQEKVKRVLSLYLQGYSIPEIAKETGYGLRSVTRYMREIRLDWSSFVSRPILEIKADKLAELRHLKKVMYGAYSTSDKNVINSKLLTESVLKILDLEIDLLSNLRLTKQDDDLDFDKIIKAIDFYDQHHGDGKDDY